MSLDFIFETQANTDTDNLHQGDILCRSEGLISVLKQAHKYYAEADDYSHFMVLTQSCDLVRRNGTPKARYITLAAIRPLDIVVERLVNKYSFDGFEFPIPVCNKANEVYVRQTIERLLHNTEDGFFFIRKDSHSLINKDMCVFLPLSVAIRNTHYDHCLNAKIAQLDKIFQAKLGWQVGNIYSRVGTPDIEEHTSDPDQYKKDFLDEIIYQKTAWLNSQQLKMLKKKSKEWLRENSGKTITQEVALTLAKEVPDNIEIISARIVDQLSQNKYIANEDDKKEEIKNIIINDRVLRNILSQ